MMVISDDKPQIEDINGAKSASWKTRMEEELTQTEKLGTWELVEAPPDAKQRDMYRYLEETLKRHLHQWFILAHSILL